VLNSGETLPLIPEESRQWKSPSPICSFSVTRKINTAFSIDGLKGDTADFQN
jgi:hypothetical protein